MELATCDVCGLSPVIASTRRSTRIIAKSPAMQRVLERAGRFAANDAPVMVFGESGSGKEVVARALHGSGARAKAPFVAVNVAALPAELLESELFGHKKGAFTGATADKVGLFEEAHGGTLFLDEIGEMPKELQAKLLRALQDGEIRRVGDVKPVHFDVRIVAATHRDLSELVRAGLFRQDLRYRLEVLTLRVPPLRERREDILPLARQLLHDEHMTAKTFSMEAEARLLAWPWPGNVRELANVVKHGAALARGELVEAEDLPDELSSKEPTRDATPLATLEEAERLHVLRVLDACGGSQVEASRVLGIARNTLWRKLRRYGGC